ncbi:LysR substrate-binding domain-containing protein [Piscinibacter sp. XHJ-5]|uniref:LysR substrate-binding domain-containing protein n=1 Tax=Piscinibacter sp. XHJ-5 TaxID=3037797 RepID=UPI002452DE4F|nr:LysR substrate-binding domain-containing protein [Piscinibacter sp. XHJ-5]
MRPPVNGRVARASSLVAARCSSAAGRRLCEVGWSLYAGRRLSRGTPSTPTRLRGHDVIGYDKAPADTPAARWIATRADASSIVMRNREMVDMVDAAAAGAGLALLPCHLAAAAPELVRITPEVLVVRELWLVYRREARLSAAVQAAIRFTIEVMEQARPALLGDAAVR